MLESLRIVFASPVMYFKEQLMNKVFMDGGSLGYFRGMGTGPWICRIACKKSKDFNMIAKVRYVLVVASCKWSVILTRDSEYWLL